MGVKASTRNTKAAIKEKLGVLRDFGIVDDNNEDKFRQILEDALKSEPDKDRDIILDRVARKYITERMRSFVY